MSIFEFLSQPLWQRLGLTLVHFLWQGLAVAVLVGAFVRVFRLNHGNARYAAYLLALVLMIACPVVTFTVIDIPISPNAEFATETESTEVVETSSYTALSAGDILPEAETSSPVVPGATAATDSIPLRERISDWLNVSMPWVLVIWMTGVIALSVRLVMGFVGVYRWRHHLKPLPERLAQRIASLSEGLGMRGFSRVFISPTVLQAMAVGYLRPMVLLPAAMVTRMQPEMLEAVIAHELAHIRRLDLWINLAQRVTETLLFYHPAVWWLSNCLRSERELCCDELAVKATGERITYATTLESVGRARFMAKPPVLAAGLGQDKKPTLSRVRHILGLAPTQRNCPFWLAGVIAVLFLAAIVIPTTLALTNQSDEKLMHFESVVVEGIRANRDKFKCGYLAWSSKQFNDRDYKGRPAAELAGEYELWWDGKKMATKYLKDQLVRDPQGNFSVEKRQGGTSYDGGVLSMKPDFGGSENWLGSWIARWRGSGSRDRMIRMYSKLENVRIDWSVVDNNGVDLIRATTTSIDKTDQEYGGYSIRDYAPSKGYGLVNEEAYNPNGSQRYKCTVKMLEVIPGGWFPVEVDMKSINRGGKVTLHQHFALDIERCSFNDKLVLPDRVFKGAVDKQLKYQEKLQKYLAMELRGLSEVKEAAKADRVKLGAREAIEEFVAAAMAGDFEKARQFADPNKAPADQVEDMPEVVGGQNLWIMAVVADDFDAIAVSSVIRGDHERIGPLVFFLDRKPQDGRDNWWVDDIDMETPDGAEVELKQFLEEHPKAKKVPYENKPTVQVEGEESVRAKNLVWGEDVNGLRASVEFVPEKESYSLGEQIGIRFYVQNVSNHTIQFTTATPRNDGTTCVVEDTHRREIVIPAIPFLGDPILVRKVLLPGQIVALESLSLGIAKDARQADSFKYPINNIAILKPGRYQLRFRLRFPDVTRWDADGKILVPQAGDWTGILETGKRKLVIVRAEEKPAVQVEGEGDVQRARLVADAKNVRASVNKGTSAATHNPATLTEFVKDWPGQGTMNIRAVPPTVAQRQEANMMDTTIGVVLSTVREGPAKDAGLQVGDFIVRIAGLTIRSSNHLIALTRAMPPGTRVNVEFVRQGKKRNAYLELGPLGWREGFPILAGAVWLPDGQSAKGAMVYPCVHHYVGTTCIELPCLTNAQGRFFTRLSTARTDPGQCFLLVSTHDGYIGYVIVNFPIETPIEIQLEKGIITKGRLSTDKGRGLSDVFMEIGGISIPSEKMRFYMLHKLRTDHEGWFVLPTLPFASKVWLDFKVSGYVTPSRGPYDLTELAQGLVFGDIGIPPLASIEGVVMGGRGEALGSFSLSWRNTSLDINGSIQVDAQGRFKSDSIPPGETTLYIDVREKRKLGYALIQKVLDLRPGEKATDLRLNAEPFGVIEGKVTDKATKQGLAGFTVTAYSEAFRDEMYSTKTNADGTYILPIPPGDITFVQFYGKWIKVKPNQKIAGVDFVSEAVRGRFNK